MPRALAVLTDGLYRLRNRADREGFRVASHVIDADDTKGCDGTSAAK